MTKNILVCKNYRVRDHSKWHRDRSRESTLTDSYNHMQRLMLQSAHKNLQDLDQVIVHGGECETIRDVFREHFWEIHELWTTGANILYCDLDVLFVRPAKYFGEFDHFAMFNYTHPARCRDPHYGIIINHYFNCGIRYYPHNMDPGLWQLGEQMVNNWNPDRWDCEQIIYNAMLWHQDINLGHTLRPELNYQMIRDPRTALGAHAAAEHNGGMLYTQACTVHFHGSRNAQNKAHIMQHVAELYNCV